MSDTTKSRPPATVAPVEEEEEESLEKLQAEIQKMEEEAARIAEETKQLERQKAAKMASSSHMATTSTSNTGTAGQTTNISLTSSAAATPTVAGAVNTNATTATSSKDACSIYVGQVDYSATPEELLAHFEACGTVERVTIVCDKFTGQPKGYAYLEFTAEDAVENAIKLDGSTFKGRTLKVTAKRTNDPNFYYNQAVAQVPGGRGRGGFRGRGSPMHGRGVPPPMMGVPPFRGGRGGRAPYRGGFRGGYGGGYHPYY